MAISGVSARTLRHCSSRTTIDLKPVTSMHNGELYMHCWKTVKNNVIGKLHFFLTLIILVSSYCTFLLIRIFFSFSSLNCSVNGLRQDMRKVSSPNWKRMLYIVIQHLQLTRLRHRTPSSGYIINLLRTCFL